MTTDAYNGTMSIIVENSEDTTPRSVICAIANDSTCDFIAMANEGICDYDGSYSFIALFEGAPYVFSVDTDRATEGVHSLPTRALTDDDISILAYSEPDTAEWLATWLAA